MARSKVYHHNDPDMRAESVDYLRTLFPIGSEVRTVVMHVAQSGMSRVIKVLAIDPRNGTTTEPARIVDVSNHVARVVGWSVDSNRGGVFVTGAGMDMCFHVVYTLSRVLYADNPDAAAVRGGNGSDVGYALTSRPL